MTSTEMKVLIAAGVAILLTIAAQVGDAVSRRGQETAQTSAEPKRTRIIQSVLDTDPAVVGSIPKRHTVPSR